MYFKLYPSYTYTVIATGWRKGDANMHTLHIRKTFDKKYTLCSTLPCAGCDLTLAQAKKYIKSFLLTCNIDSIDYSNTPYTIVDRHNKPYTQVETKREAEEILWNLNWDRRFKFRITREFVWNT